MNICTYWVTAHCGGMKLLNGNRILLTNPSFHSFFFFYSVGLNKAERGKISAKIHYSYQPKSQRSCNREDKPIPAVVSSACRKWQIKIWGLNIKYLLNSEQIWTQLWIFFPLFYPYDIVSLTDEPHAVFHLLMPHHKIKFIYISHFPY